MVITGRDKVWERRWKQAGEGEEEAKEGTAGLVMKELQRRGDTSSRRADFWTK